MNWLQRYGLRLYLRNSLWIVPAMGIVAALLTAALLIRLDRTMGWEMDVSPETGRAVISTVAASMFTLVVLVCTAVLLAVQLASAQLTPRIIAFVYRNPGRKLLLALFVFTFTFSVASLVRIEQSVPWLTGYVAAYGFLLNLVLLLYFVESIGKTLRPSHALRHVALLGRDVIQTVYPQQVYEEHSAPVHQLPDHDGTKVRTVFNSSNGVVLALNLKGLVSLAEKADCVIELIPEVGDFVAGGDPLFRIYEGGDGLADDTLRQAIALGQERTIDQDPMFAFRIMVDIASKALSPAVNDPTTAVVAIDQIHHLLREVGNRHLANGRETDARGRVRLVYRTPNWEDFVSLAVTEIRQYGSSSIQVMRRLQAMLESLIASLPEYRRPQLEFELDLLRITVKRTFIEPRERVQASVSDLQGVGGRPNDNRSRETNQSERTLKASATLDSK